MKLCLEFSINLVIVLELTMSLSKQARCQRHHISRRKEFADTSIMMLSFLQTNPTWNMLGVMLCLAHFFVVFHVRCWDHKEGFLCFPGEMGLQKKFPM